MKLRDYQQHTIDLLYEWFENNPEGNPCIDLPTGAGKSLIIAALCKDAITNWPDTRILMLTHQKELITQNAERLRQYWPNAPLGIYSASVGMREIDHITFGGIQTVRKRAEEIGHIDLCLIDEAHLISHKDEGSYRKLINDLHEINPNMRVIGLTATPYRMTHGLITDDPAIFDDILEPTSIIDLQNDGYLCDLKSKVTREKLSVDGVHKRGGEYVESELQKAVDTYDHNKNVVSEVIEIADRHERKHWIFFCTGVDHALHIRDILNESGISAETITGKTPKKEREQLIDDFKTGQIKALTNANVLTTGFDAPNTDLIVMLRPTMSPGLYVQMVGRGMRPKTHTDYCLVLDFAGVVETHGPIISVREPGKVKEGDGIAPSKICPECDEIVPAQIRICPNCDYEFPKQEKEPPKLRNDDIMGKDPIEEYINRWEWSIYNSKRSGKDMIKVDYYTTSLGGWPISEYLCVFHDGYALQKATEIIKRIGKQLEIDVMKYETPNELIRAMNEQPPPEMIQYIYEGKYKRILNRKWEEIPF